METEIIHCKSCHQEYEVITDQDGIVIHSTKHCNDKTSNIDKALKEIGRQLSLSGNIKWNKEKK